MSRDNRTFLSVAFGGLTVALVAHGGLGAERQAADAILRAAGIESGLVVHLGCGDGKLTAGLRTCDRFLVHGLDTDAINVAAARKHIQSLGLYGAVSAASKRRQAGSLSHSGLAHVSSRSQP